MKHVVLCQIKDHSYATFASIETRYIGTTQAGILFFLNSSNQNPFSFDKKIDIFLFIRWSKKLFSKYFYFQFLKAGYLLIGEVFLRLLKILITVLFETKFCVI
jgi:hypothetical protein